jgi:hypothetical protein
MKTAGDAGDAEGIQALDCGEVRVMPGAAVAGDAAKKSKPLLPEHPLRFSLQIKSPTGGLLGACSGRLPVGYRFSLLTLLFSGVFVQIKPGWAEKFRQSQKNFSKSP